MKTRFHFDPYQLFALVPKYKFYALRNIECLDNQKLAIFKFLKDMKFNKEIFINVLPTNIPIDMVFKVVNITHGYELPFMLIDENAEVELFSIN